MTQRVPLAPKRLKQCGWEIYLKNLGPIYKNSAVYFSVLNGGAFFVKNTLSHPFLRLLALLLWVVALTPIEMWWRKSLLDLIKGEQTDLRTCLSYYRDDPFVWKGSVPRLFQGAWGMWFLGISYGFQYNGAASIFYLTVWSFCILLSWLAPFFVTLFIQPYYVELLLQPGRRMTGLFYQALMAMKGQRAQLLCLWRALGGWLILLAGPYLLVSIANHPLSLFLSYVLLGISCIVILPYVTLCGNFFSLKLLEEP